MNDVLFSRFCPVPGPGPAASGPLLHHCQPSAAVSYGGNHVHPAGSTGQLYLVLWWTWRWRTSGESKTLNFDQMMMISFNLLHLQSFKPSQTDPFSVKHCIQPLVYFGKCTLEYWHCYYYFSRFSSAVLVKSFFVPVCLEHL